jgi:hypothetical protein
VKKYIEALSGITYHEWIRLRNSVDRSFEFSRKELEKSIQLDLDMTEKIIHSQFGGKSD